MTLKGPAKKDTCPATLELLRFVNDGHSKDGGVENHLGGCIQCSSIVEDLRSRRMEPPSIPTQHVELLSSPSMRVYGEKPPSGALKGQVWSTKSLLAHRDGEVVEVDVPMIVVVLEGTESNSKDERIVVSPISIETEFATKHDLIVSSDISLLGYDFMVEVWNYTTMIIDHLDCYLGSLPDRYVGYLETVRKVVNSPIREFGEVQSYVGNLVPKEGNEVFFFQEQEMEAVRYLEIPALHTEVGAFDSLRDEKSVLIDFGTSPQEIVETYKTIRRQAGASIILNPPLMVSKVLRLDLNNPTKAADLFEAIRIVLLSTLHHSTVPISTKAARR